MPQNYLSVEDMLRKQQMQQLGQIQGQPYAMDQEQDMGNMGDIDTLMAQQYGTADYAEMMRQGASAQRGASTTHYSPQLGVQRGYQGEELPGYDVSRSAAQPGALGWGVGQAGMGAALAGMGIQKGVGSMQSRIAGVGQRSQVLNPYRGPGGAGGTGQPGPTVGSDLSTGMAGSFSPFANTEAVQQAMTSVTGRGSQLGADLVATQQGGQAGGQGPGTGGSAAGAGAGLAAGMLTSYLINRYTDAPEGVAQIGGATVGGAVAGGVGGVGASGASAGAGGAAAGGAGAIAGGAIMGGSGGVIAYVASKIIGKHIFGVGKESGRDVASRQFYESYHGKSYGKQAEREGFTGRDDAMSQPYKWMGQDARDYRSQIAAGQTPEASYKLQQAYKVPDYKPTEWEAWVGGMSDAGYKMKDIFDASAYYMSDAGHDRMSDANKDFKRGEAWYMDPKNDPTKMSGMASGSKTPFGSSHVTYRERHGQGDLLATEQAEYNTRKDKIASGEGWQTDEQRSDRWASVQEKKQATENPWQTEGFRDMYEKEYGHMKDTPTRMSSKAFRKQYGSLQYAERHNRVDAYFENRKKHLIGGGPSTSSSIASIGRSDYQQEGAKSRNVSERSGITDTKFWDTRNLYGSGEADYLPKKYRKVVTGNTGGEGGHDIYGYESYTGDDIDDNFVPDFGGN